MVTTHLLDATLIDGTGRDPVEGAWLRLEDDRIAAIGHGPLTSSPSTYGGRVIDCAGRTVMPGLIDCHTHLAAGDYLNQVHLLPKPVLAARTFNAIRDTLESGFTTIRDAGFTDYGFKQAVNQGLAPGPRMLLATGPISQTGGHSDFRTAEEATLRSPDGLYHPGVVADGVDEVRKAAREVLRRGADQVKVMASGGCTSPTDDVDHSQFTPEELAAIVYEATVRDTYVMAHAYTPASIQNCIAAGVRSIEHGNGVDEETATMMREHATFAVPTIATYEMLAADGSAGGMPAGQVDQVKRVLAKAYDALELLRDTGVRIASGSDVLGPHQHLKTYELELKARVLGPMGALVSATKTSAELLGLDDQIGTLEEGKVADLVIFDGDPLQDIKALQDTARVHVVMTGGMAAVDRTRP